MRASRAAVMFCGLSLGMLSTCDSSHAIKANEDPPPPKPTGPPVHAVALAFAVDARRLVSGANELYGEAALDSGAAAAFAGFISEASRILGGRAPGHVGLRSARLDAVELQPGPHGADEAALELDLALGLMAGRSQRVYPVAGTAAGVPAAPGALAAQWDPGDVASADWEDLFGGRFTAVVWGRQSTARASAYIHDLEGAVVHLRFSVELEAYADPLPSGRRFGNPGATLCPAGATSADCGAAPAPAPWEPGCEEEARDHCATAARCCPGSRIDEVRCRDSTFASCGETARSNIASGFAYDAQAAQSCHAARRKLADGCREGGGAQLADALEGLQCDRVFTHPRHGLYDHCGNGWCDDPGPGFRAVCIPYGDAPDRCGSVRVAQPGRSCGTDADGYYFECAEPYVCDSRGVCAFGSAAGAACSDPRDCWSGLCEDGRCAAGPPLLDANDCKWAAETAAVIAHAHGLDLAIDAGRVFMGLPVDHDDDLAWLPAAGGRPVTLLRLRDLQDVAPVPSGDHVYFTVLGRALGLYRVAKAGGKPQLMPLPITARDDLRFVTSGDEVFTASGRCAFLGRGRLAGGPFTVTLNRAALATPGELTEPALLAVDDASVYCASHRQLWRAPRAGGPVELVAEVDGEVAALAVGAGKLVYTQNGLERLLIARPVDGGPPRTLLRAGQSLDGRIHLDARRGIVYLMGQGATGGRELQAVALADGAVTPVSTLDGAYDDVVGDDDFLYYEVGSGITRVAK